MNNVQEAFKTWYKSKYYKYDLYPKYHQFRIEVEDAFIQGYKAALAEDEASSTGSSNNAIDNCEDVARVQHDMSVEWNPKLQEDLPVGTKLYIAPPPKEWVSLSSDQLNECWVDDTSYFDPKLIEAKLKQLNTKD